jgi:hypothetical protein
MSAGTLPLTLADCLMRFCRRNWVRRPLRAEAYPCRFPKLSLRKVLARVAIPLKKGLNAKEGLSDQQDLHRRAGLPALELTLPFLREQALPWFSEPSVAGPIKPPHRCSGVDEQLPGVGVVEVGSCRRPHDDGEEGNQEGPIGANRMCRLLSKVAEYLMSQLLVVALWRCTSARRSTH